MRPHRFRRTFLGIAFIARLMAMALSCGGAAESPAAASPAAADLSDLSATPASARGSAGPPGAPAMESAQQAAMPAATAAPQAVSQQASPTAAPAQPRPASAAMEPAAEQQAQSQQPQSGRQLIVEAWVSLEVNEIDATVRQVEALAAQRGGWMESAEIFGEGGYRSASLRVRVPADDLDNTMDALRGLGRVTDEGISATDVTDRLIDNEARLAAWYVQEERLVDLLENAPTVEDIIQIERRISEVRSDIEHVEATQRNLADRVATSLITVNLRLPGRFAADPPDGALTLAVGDPSATADAIASRVEGLNGYVGEKREYDEGRSQAVDMVVFVKPADLAELMDYAATLGEASGRQLNSVGSPAASDVPSAPLRLAVRSNVDLEASLSLSSADPIAVAEQIRTRAESLDGYVEKWAEVRRDEDDFVTLEMELVVRSSDLRDIMEFGARLGDTQYWGYDALGQNPAADAPDARLTVAVFTDHDDGEIWLIAGVIAAAMAGAVIVVAVVLLLRRLRRRAAAPSTADLIPDTAQ